MSAAHDNLPPLDGAPEPAVPGGIDTPELSISTGSALTLAAKVIGLGTSFAVGVLVARLFGPEGKGTLSLIMQVPGLLVVILDLGISTSIVYYVSKGELRPGTAAGNALALAAALGVLGAPVIFVLLSGPFALVPGVPMWAVVTAVAILPLGLLAGWLSGISVGLSNLAMPLRYSLLSSLTTLAGLVALLATGRSSLTGVLVVSVAGTAVGIAAYLVGLRRHLSPLKLDITAARGMARFSAKAYLTGLAGLFHERQDILLLGWLAGTGAVGLYTVGVSFAEIAWYIPGALGSAVLAKGRRHGEDSTVDYTTRTTRVAVVFMLATILASMVAVPFVIPFVYGSAFAPAMYAFFALTPGILADGVSRVLWGYQVTRGRMYWRLALGTMALNIVLVVALAPVLGAVGAGLASSFSYVTLAILTIRHFCIDTGSSVASVVVPQASDVRIIVRTLKRMVARTS